jgi:rare lipoprotein A
MASYYGREFNGRKTASGERFDMHKFTAAHRELPFGTMVKVTNLANGKTVVVRVNDRGPFKRDRIIDLSLAAGKAIEMMGTGTARVKIEIVK